MKQFHILTVICVLLAGLSGCQQPVGGQNRGLFGIPKPQLFSQSSAQGNNGGFGSNLAKLFDGSSKTPAAGIQLPSDPNQQAEWFNSLAGQVQSLNSRLGQFDSDNQQLHTELASYRQKIQAAGDYNYQLKQQLTDTITQVQQLQNDKLNLEQQLATSRLGPSGNGGSGQPGMLASGAAAVPSQLPGTAVLRANNSLLQQLPQLNIPGVKAQMDGDVIRIEIPSDSLFVPGTYNISNQHGAMLQEIAGAINRSFPRQIVGIEAHWDGTPIQPASTTHHQLTASQSLAVFDFMKRLGLPERQFFTMAMGSNRPRHPVGGPTNRRVELVIYPENWDGK
jgi:flagellar motor protein MotB